MDLKKQKSIIILIALMMISTGLLAGCTSNTGDNNNNNAAAGSPVMSGTDISIMNNAYDEYELLKETLSYAEARQQLLEKLNNETQGVEKAELGLDGYTIFVTYSDGDFAGVDTFEPNESSSPSSGTSFSVLNGGYTNGHKYKNEISFDTFAESNKKITTGSKKVLILGPCYYDFNTEPYEESIDYLKDHGWTDDDIVMKVVDRKSGSYIDNNYDNLKPDDFFDLSDYGIILYTGHGGVNVYANFNEDNIYLQFCFITNDSYAKYPYLKTWKDDKKLLLIKEHTEHDGDKEIDWYRTALRADVLREKLDTLPNSYMHLSTCFGARFNKVFLDHGAKMFLGWTLKVNGDIADANMLNLNKLMLGNNCLYDAFMNDLVTKIDVWSDIYFDIYSDEDADASNFYFPAWVDLTVTGIPSGTSYIKSSLYDSSSSLIGETTDTVGSSATQINCVNFKDVLAPATEEVTVEVKAFGSSGSELSSGEQTFTLDAGSNSLQIALAQNQELTIVFDPENGQLDVRRTMWYLSVEARFENAPNGNLLYVWDASGAEGLGGFTYNMVQHYEQYDSDVSFYSTGSGTDGTKISITLSVYLVEGEDRQLLQTASATIDVYNPTTRYSLVDQDDKTGWGAGSWEFYNLGHGYISYEFYARSGDQIRIVCTYKGYYADWEHPQVYLKQGETKTFLFSVDDIPDGGSFDRTFTVP
jgi:hypothetical protein